MIVRDGQIYAWTTMVGDQIVSRIVEDIFWEVIAHELLCKGIVGMK